MISFDTNNGGILTVHQDKHDNQLEVMSSNIGTFYISAADFVSMLNWYRYQKDIGNKNLEF